MTLNINSRMFSEAVYTDGNLILTFFSGPTYTYKNVPQTVVDNMVNAESAGKFFRHNIRDCYHTTKI